MTIADFCLEYRFRPRRVRRRVREAILDRVETEPGRSPEVQDGWRVDLTEEIGARAEKPEGHQRPSYEVTDDGQLEKWLIGELGTQRLSREEIKLIAEVARAYYEAAHQQSEFILTHRQDGGVFSPNEEFFDPLDELLRRIGA